jgi:hypothetical protein
MSDRVLSRVIRRETHSPRTVAMAVAVVLVILALIYVGLEIVLDLLSQPALLIAPADALAQLADVPGIQPSGTVIGVGVLVAVVGLVFLVLSLTPGRLSKHRMDIGDRAIIVDNGVLAASLAQRISDEAGIPRDHITVGVAHRVVDVVITPDAGLPIDASRVRLIADEEMAGYRLTPPVKTVVKIAAPKEQEFSR